MRLQWLPQAIANRVEQIAYIGQDNPLAAITQGDRIAEQVNMLMEHPQMGRPGRKKGTRELVISRTPYVVVYRIKDTDIEVIRVLHSSQKYP